MSKYYDLYIDDSGSRYSNKPTTTSPPPIYDAFGLGGILVESELTSIIIEAHKKLIKEWEIPVPLRSSEIRAKQGYWKWLKDDNEKAQKFYESLNDLIINSPGLVTGCIIDRKGYVHRYKPKYDTRWMLCKSAYTILLERSAKYALENNRKLKVYIEETGKREDRALKRYHKEVQTDGMYFDEKSSEKYNPLSAQNLSEVLLKEPKFIKKKNPLAQISDLVLYPIIRGRFDPAYLPYEVLLNGSKLIDCIYTEDSERNEKGIKYFCFDGKV